jgi:hypothetical protein
MLTFQGPVWLIVATFFGALLLWCKEPPDTLRVYKLSTITDRIPNRSVRYWVQLGVFLTLGTFVALAFTSPSNVRQAFAAGLGWTAGLCGSRTNRVR